MSRFKIKWKIAYTGAILVAVPLVFELVLVGWLSHALYQAKAEMDSEAQSRAVVAESSAMSRSVVDCGMILFALRFTSDPKFIDRFNDKLKEEEMHLASLQELSQGNERQSPQVRELTAVSQEMSSMLRKYGRPADDSADPHSYLIRSGSALRSMFTPVLAHLNEVVSRLNSGEKEFQDSAHRAAADSWRHIAAILFVMVVFSIVSGIGLAVFFIRGILRRIQALQGNAERLVSRQALETPVEGTDELAALDRDLYEIATALRNADQRKQEFTSMISHDLRTPLTSLQGTFTMMHRGVYGELTENGKERASAGERNVQRLIALISDLLDIDKIESGMLDLNVEDVALEDVIEGAIEMVRDFAEQKNISITTSDCTSEVEADRKRLSQVVQNLVGNAIKFSPQGSEIKIDVEERNGKVKVSVSDSGPGIPQDEIGEMFQRFKQTSHGKRQLGTGLGLAICKAVITQHQGEIGVESREGHGSTFWFTLTTLARRRGRSSSDTSSNTSKAQGRE